MKVRVTKPDNLTAEVLLPASKSISNRALLLAALSGAPVASLSNISDCDDTRAMLTALTSEDSTIDIGAAGTAMRFMTAWLSLANGKDALQAGPTRLLTGSARMCQRPIGVLVEALRQLGAQIEYADAEGLPPLRITPSRLHGGTLSVRGDISSQYVSALLMIAPMLEEGLRLNLSGTIASRPYIEMTLAMMRHFGAQARWSDDHTVEVDPVVYRPAAYTIESDWSAASYWYEIVFLSDNEHETATLKGLFENSLQGDSGLTELFAQLGVQGMPISQGTRDPRFLLSRRGTAPQRFEWDFTRMPDLVQTFVVACAMRDIAFRFCGVKSLRIKETDRIAALQRELDKLGVTIENDGDDVLYWEGSLHQRQASTAYLQPAAGMAVDTYNDHRMAMAFAPSDMVLGSIDINDAGVVAKSYPRFWDDLQNAGFGITQLS